MLKKLYNKATEYRYRFMWYLVLLVITLVIATLLNQVVWDRLLPKVPQTGNEATNTINECYVYNPNIPYYPKIETQVALIQNTVPVIPVVPVISDHKKLVDCLIKWESGGNENAINPRDIDGRPKYGLLQFDARTFDNYCVQKYGLPDDIFNGEVQRYCCIKMISEGQARQWGTLSYCLN